MVAIPAYTCFTVPASVVRAGLRIFPVDVDPETLDVNPSELRAVPPERLLCVLACNLFGLVSDVRCLRAIARAKGAFLVDDAAQALGASRGGQRAGAMGDVGFYSLGRGKALAAGAGGLIVTQNDEIARALRDEDAALPTPSLPDRFGLFAKTLLYAVFLRPRLYWIPNSLAFLKLGLTEYDPKFPASQSSGIPLAILDQLSAGLAETNRRRRGKAQILAEALAGHPHFMIPTPAQDSQPAYIRFPVIARDQAVRDQALSQLRAAGIGASPGYPSAICDIEDLRQHMAEVDFHRPRAEALSRGLLTLPTHHFVEHDDLDRIIRIMKAV